jgi:Periplasmic protein TonB, links inner and outer membranes
MPNSKIVLLIAGFLVLLLVAQVIFQVNTRAESAGDDSDGAIISGVLAHNMNESQAKLLSENGFFVEADVELGENSSWQNTYSLCKQYNISLIGKLCHNTMNGNISAPSSADWIQTIQTAVSNYSDVVKYWEIWNEPTDSTNFFAGNASEYTEMLKLAYQTIKSMSPDAVVIGLGGLHLYTGDEDWVTKGLDFARNVTDLGGMNYCDAISLHAYPWGDYTVEVGNKIAQSLQQYRDITQKPVWITETGQHSGSLGYDEKDQASFLYESYKLMKSQNVSAYIWYELGDSEGNKSSPQEDTFGLFDVNSNPKLAFQTYVIVKSEAITVKAAVDYLANCYNPDIGLIYETPDNNGTTYWLYTDNYLAQLALAPYAQDKTIAQVLGGIKAVSSKTDPDIVNQYQILNGSAFSLPINCTSNYKIAELNGVPVYCTVNNGTSTLGPKDYADIAFLEAIAYHNANQTEKALLAYHDGAAMWNGIGFNDTVYRSYTDGRGYDTFKLALYIYASKVLNCSFDVRAYNNLLSCQLSSGVSGIANRGGFATYYTANGATNNQTNTETTALAILALTYAPIKEEAPTPPPSQPPVPTPTPTVTITPTPTPTSRPTDNPTPTPTPSTPTPTPSPPTPTPTPTTTLTPTLQSTTPTSTPQPVSFTANSLFYIAVGASVAGLTAVGCLFLLKKK